MTKREIKFRAWDSSLNLMGRVIEIDWVNNTPNYMRVQLFDDMSKVRHYHSANHIAECGLEVEQYTGLKDADGVEVYENDLLETDWIIDSEGYFITELGQVVWRGNGWKVLVDGNKYDLISAWEENGFAVIGNIHQNPELLGE